MKLRILSVLTALVLMLVFLPAYGEKNAFETFAKGRFSARDCVGGAVIISRNGEVLFSCAYGWRNAGKNKPASLDTCFRIASVTKLVTAVGLIKLMEEKGLSYDTDVGDILGYPVRNPAFPKTPITVRNVLTHTTGLKTGFSFHPNWEALRKENRYFDDNVAPGTKYVYANLNGGLMGAMIEALSGQSVNTYMRENVFEPLGINAAYHPGLLPDQSDVASQLTEEGKNLVTADKEIATLPDYNDVCDPRENTGITVGQLYISANGLNRIICMLQNDGELDGVRILPAGTVAKMTESQLFEGSSVHIDCQYTLGLDRVFDMPGGIWYGHQGHKEGMTSNVYFQPDTGLTVVVIGNGFEYHKKNGISTLAIYFMEYAVEHMDDVN